MLEIIKVTESEGDNICSNCKPGHVLQGSDSKSNPCRLLWHSDKHNMLLQLKDCYRPSNCSPGWGCGPSAGCGPK